MNPTQVQTLYRRLRREADKVLVGLEESFELLVVALLTGGHVLLEGVPGTAKTLMAKTLAALVDTRFTRVQFTPDMMPSDILGTSVFNLTTGKFYLKRGPIFTNVLLADEINRAPAKTQSALLEAMEERQVNLEGQRYPLPPPFMVVATQNPVEYEGTYPLPEAQLDRFLFKALVPYVPSPQEVEILRRYHRGFDPHDLAAAGLEPVLSVAELLEARGAIEGVTVEEGLFDYIAAVSDASRRSPDLILGASPRASTHVLLASKVYAALQGRDYVSPDDVKYIFPHVMRHRLLLKPEAEIEGLTPDAVMGRLLAQVDVPR
jgi:MoxR-like ATPase